MSKQRTKLVPPDGGWGILVCIGMALSFNCALAAIPSFGLVFGEFLHNIGAESSAVAFLTSAFFFAYSFAGLCSGSLFKRFGLRAVGLVGGTFYFVGSVAQIFVNSVVGLAFAFSVLQGVAFGLMVPTAYTTFNNYFVKKRVMWMSFAQSLIGLGGMVYPVAMERLLAAYGFRGCLMILAGINAHALLGMLLMHPVEWHMKRVPLNDQELAELNVGANAAEQQAPLMPPVQSKRNSLLFPREETENLSRRASSKRNSLLYPREETEYLSRRASSITSLGNWTGSIVVSDASPQMTRVPSRRTSVVSTNQTVGQPETAVVAVETTETFLTKWEWVVDFLDLTLLKKPVYVNLVLGVSLALYSDMAFFAFHPLYLSELKFSNTDIASIIAIGASADLASRIFLAFAAVCIKTPSRYIYLAGSLFTVITRFAFLHVFDFTGMAIITAIMGFLRTWIHVPLPLVFAEYLPKERFAKGYGLFMFLQGNIMFAIGPIVGLLRDLTNDYTITFHCLTFFMAMCAFPWLIEIIYLKFRRKRKASGAVQPVGPRVVISH